MMEENKEGLQAEIERLQTQVKTQEKLSSLGMLSAGIAHEIQNPLNFVLNFSKMSRRLLEELKEEIARQTLKDNDETGEIISELNQNLGKIEENGERAISIIRGILLYSRGKEDEFVETDICRLVKEYVWLAYHAMRANDKGFNIAIREEYDRNLPLMKVIPQDFCRVVLNLVNNACYAVKMKFLQQGQVYLPEIKIRVNGQGQGFLLLVEDNGMGMPEEVKNNLFTAFYTTKPIGEGTGLGLSIARSIVEEKHRGKIWVETVEGRGSKFGVEISQ